MFFIFFSSQDIFLEISFSPRNFFISNLKQMFCIKFTAIENYLLSKSESVKFSLIESLIRLFTDSSVKKYVLLSNQSIFTEIISEIWLIYSNLFLAIRISQISLVISRFWRIQIERVNEKKKGVLDFLKVAVLNLLTLF